MRKNILFYVSEFIPASLKIENLPAIKEIIEMIYQKELAGEGGFSAEAIPDSRKRAALAMPYQVDEDLLEKREHYLNVIEYCILQHRQKKHDEDHAERIYDLMLVDVYTDEELEIMGMDFWN